MKNLLYICNPVSGRGRAKERLSDIISFYNDLGFAPRVVMTAPHRDITGEIAELSDEDFLVCSGGDGMVNLMIDTMAKLGRDIPIGYIPMGTTNDFSKSIGLPKELEALLKASVSEHKLRLDAGELMGRRFAYVAGFGNFTDISYKTPRVTKNLLGYLAYVLEGAKSISDIRPFHVRVGVGDELLEADYILGLVTNSTSVAGVRPLGGFETKLDDGLMELVLIKMPKKLSELREILGSYLSQEQGSELIEYRQGRSFSFESPKLAWTLDGEFGGCYDRTDIRVIPSAFSVRVPEPDVKSGGYKQKGGEIHA